MEISDNENPAYAVLWKYSDGSGCGVVAVSEDEGAAAEMLKFLNEHGDPSKTFSVASARWIV